MYYMNMPCLITENSRTCSLFSRVGKAGMLSWTAGEWAVALVCMYVGTAGALCMYVLWTTLTEVGIWMYQDKSTWVVIYFGESVHYKLWL